ncbi:MAG TPA: 6-carboxyhexanoate--CoA ligase [Aquificales bacterium]|nr:6-carboxyhexanoate--CoA ligase [Aquificales bacterium]
MFYSVRMRATLEGKHVSGQERIVKKEDLERVILELHRRPKGDWDFQTLKVERLKQPPEVIEKSLPVRSYKFSCVPLAVNFIVGILETEHGIGREITKPLLAKLQKGLNPEGGNLKGALIVDPKTGEVLNEDPTEGVRTILFDWLDRERVRDELLKRGYTERTLDALALATKNIYCGVEAEVCISDDPDYTTGYVASERLGYIRISPIKEKGSPFGGRIYFVSREKLEETLRCLRKKALLIRELSTLG